MITLSPSIDGSVDGSIALDEDVFVLASLDLRLVYMQMQPPT